MPPLPPWSGAHPLIVHFPIALLMTAPLLILLAIVSRRSWRPLAAAALIVMLLGVGATLAALNSGEAGEDAAKALPAAKAALERHEELAEQTRTIFLVLGVAFAGVVGVTSLSPRVGRRGFVIGSLLFLAPYSYGAIMLARTAHEGGVLVHQYGVHAPIAGTASTTPGASEIVPRQHDDDD
jgi:uncharacterized membrane protein